MSVTFTNLRRWSDLQPKEGRNLSYPDIELGRNPVAPKLSPSLMADGPAQSQDSTVAPAQTPLLDSNHNDADEVRETNEEETEVNTDLDETLEKLEVFLTFLGFNQSSALSLSLSWVGFLVVGVLVPVLVLELSNCNGCEHYQIVTFELDILGYQTCLAAVSLLCLSHNLRKHGIRKFLFVDRYSGHMACFSHLYIKQISDSMRLLFWWSLPCFMLKTAREIIRILYGNHPSWWLSIAIVLALVLSWTYVSTICLSASILFHLVCNLQVIHFDDYAKLLERESDALIFIEEHIRLKHHLSKISHRFRIFLLLYCFIVTATQFVTLLQTTGYKGIITFVNSGDFAVSSIVQVVGMFICLHAATKISHRAEGIAAIASRWHALATCGPTDSNHRRGSGSVANSDSLFMTPSESDLESLENVAMPTNTQIASYLSSYHRRQSLVMYLLANPGGLTIFGWTVNRSLLNIIFFVELTLITFVLGQTLVLSSSY